MSRSRGDDGSRTDARAPEGEAGYQGSLFDVSGLQVAPEDFAPVFAEGNFEEHPLFRMSSQERMAKAYSYEWAHEAEDGLLLKKRWTVVPSGQYGAPGPADQDVFVGVMELVALRGGLPENGQIDFSLNELLKVLRKSRGGKSYEALKESLLRIAFTGIESQNSFYSASMKSYIEDTFRIWDVRFADYTASSGSSVSRHTLKFHEVFVNNYFAHYLKNLDTKLYWSLKSPIAKRLYRLIDQKRGQGRFWGQDLFELSRQIPLAGSYKYSSKVKEKLRSPHSELEDAGFLQSVSYQGGRAIYEVTEEYSRQRSVREVYRNSPQQIFAIERLISEGIRGDVAQSLVEESGVEHCLHYAEALPNQQGLSNPAGWLIEAIRKGYELPRVQSASEALRFSESQSNSAKDFETLSHNLAPNPDQDPLEANSYNTSPSTPSTDSVGTPTSAISEERQLADELFQEMLAESTGTRTSAAWFDEVYADSLQDGTLTLVAPNERVRDYILGRFKERIELVLSSKLAERGLGSEGSLNLIVSGDGG